MAIKLIEVEATKRLPDSVRIGDYKELWALVRSEGVPLGYARVKKPPAELSSDQLLKAISLACRHNLVRHQMYKHFIGGRRRSETNADDLLMPTVSDAPADRPVISVIVCTRDRPDTLKETLRSLENLDYPEYEVSVVDNRPSTTETRELVAQYPFRYILEPRPGLDWARNRGIAEAKGEIVAFIDDDAVADPGWLSGVADGFADPEAVCVTGLVLPAELETRAQELFEVAYGGLGKGFRRKVFRPETLWRHASYWTRGFGAGCNMSFRREALLNGLGTFDTALDVGTPSGGGGDTDMFHRLVESKSLIVYRPEALMFHRHRDTEAQLQKQMFDYGRSFTALLTKYFLNEPQSRRRLLRLSVKWLLVWIIGRLVRRLLRLEPMPMRFLIAEAAGAVTGPFAYFHSVKHATEIAKSYAVSAKEPKVARTEVLRVEITQPIRPQLRSSDDCRKLKLFLTAEGEPLGYGHLAMGNLPISEDEARYEISQQLSGGALGRFADLLVLPRLKCALNRQKNIDGVHSSYEIEH